jgi:hypothetical protein
MAQETGDELTTVNTRANTLWAGVVFFDGSDGGSK